MIQKELNYYFNTSNVTIQRKNNGATSRKNTISIHLMLLFNSFKNSLSEPPYLISIHLMLLFNLRLEWNNRRNDIISIHLMLLFNMYLKALNILLIHFNTSNVTIQPNDFKPSILQPIPLYPLY